MMKECLPEVDLVLELPFPWCASGAESFARCGVKIASEFVDTLIFGSECGDIDLLRHAASICADEAFVEEYKSSLKGNKGAAEVYFEMLSDRTGREYSSNDILGIEYIKAALRMNSDVSFSTTSRLGGAYASAEISGGDLQSASAIRALIYSGELERVKPYMPAECFDILHGAISKGEFTDTKKLDVAIRLYFRMCSPSDISECAECDMGIASRICSAARECRDEDIMELLRTKRYTDARLRRAVIFALSKTNRDDVIALPAYTNLLAANACGRELLAQRRKNAKIAVLAKAADIPSTPDAQRQAELSAKLDCIFAVALKKEISPADMLRRSPVIY
jgi:predicted nucleotidyltransferase